MRARPRAHGRLDGRHPGRPAGSEATATTAVEGGEARRAKEEISAQQEWKEQARRRRTSRGPRRGAAARRQAKEAQDSAREEVQRIARHVQDQVQDARRGGDWPTGVREGLTELTKELGQFGVNTPGGRMDAPTTSWGQAADAPVYPVKEEPGSGRDGAAEAEHEDHDADVDDTADDDTPPSGDPFRDLERLLDRFRDEVRDAARDLGVTEPQVREARRHLKEAAARIAAALRGDRKP